MGVCSGDVFEHRKHFNVRESVPCPLHNITEASLLCGCRNRRVVVQSGYMVGRVHAKGISKTLCYKDVPPKTFILD